MAAWGSLLVAYATFGTNSGPVTCQQLHLVTLQLTKPVSNQILQFVHLSYTDTPYDAYHTKMTVSYSTVPCRTCSSVHAALL